MASGYAPDTLNERHRLIAYMMIGGASNIEIGETLGLHPNRVSTIKGSPMFQVLLKDLRDQLRSQSVGGVVDRIMGEAGRSLDVLIELRDQAAGVPVENAVRRGAANDILDRNPVLARITRQDVTTEHRIVLDGHAMRRIAGAIEEDPGPSEPVALPLGDGIIPIIPLEEAVANARAAEREAAA